jgi:hypothetical protein
MRNSVAAQKLAERGLIIWNGETLQSMKEEDEEDARNRLAQVVQLLYEYGKPVQDDENE